MKKSVFYYLSLMLTLLQSDLAIAWNELREYQTGQWDFKAKTQYYQANANYSATGNEYESLPAGANYSLTTFDFGTRWNFSRGIGIYAEGQSAYAQSTSALGAARTNSTFNHFKIGGDWVIWSGKGYQWIPDFSILIPVTKVSTTDDAVLTNEGAVELSGQLLGRFSWGRFTPYASAGYIYRDGGRSGLLPYAGGLSFFVFDSTMGAELRGYFSANQDEFSNNPLSREQVSTRNGGALKFYTVNPSILNANFWWRTGFQREWEMELGGGFSMTGANTAAGMQVYGILHYFLKSRPQPTPQKPLLERFQEQTEDGVNQEIFDSAPLVTPPPAPPPQPVSNPRSKKRKLNEKSLQQQLDETEMQIELKRYDDPNNQR